MKSLTLRPAGETSPLLFSALWRMVGACVLMLGLIGTARAAFPTLSFDKLYASYGVLEFGSWTDPETGFVSLLRLHDARFDTP